MKAWLIYIILLVFAVYWVSNLFLWYPWSYDSTLGMILMLTVAPVAWAYTIYLALITYPKNQLIKGAFIIAIVFVLSAIVLDFIFFGVIRNAIEELYHPTTLYGYGFLLMLPFIIAVLMRRKISLNKKKVKKKGQLKAGVVGVLCLSVIILIIVLDLQIT